MGERSSPVEAERLRSIQASVERFYKVPFTGKNYSEMTEIKDRKKDVILALSRAISEVSLISQEGNNNWWWSFNIYVDTPLSDPKIKMVQDEVGMDVRLHFTTNNILQNHLRKRGESARY